MIKKQPLNLLGVPMIFFLIYIISLIVFLVFAKFERDEGTKTAVVIFGVLPLINTAIIFLFVLIAIFSLITSALLWIVK